MWLHCCEKSWGIPSAPIHLCRPTGWPKRRLFARRLNCSHRFALSWSPSCWNCGTVPRLLRRTAGKPVGTTIVELPKMAPTAERNRAAHSGVDRSLEPCGQGKARRARMQGGLKAARARLEDGSAWAWCRRPAPRGGRKGNSWPVNSRQSNNFRHSVATGTQVELVGSDPFSFSLGNPLRPLLP